MPTSGPITQGFGEDESWIAPGLTWNKGIDIGAALGTPIQATVGGTVIFVGVNDGWGNQVIVQDAEGNLHHYGHMQDGSFAVEVGQQVGGGALLGSVGNSGVSTGPHLSYDVKSAGGEWVDPGTWTGGDAFPQSTGGGTTATPAASGPKEYGNIRITPIGGGRAIVEVKLPDGTWDYDSDIAYSEDRTGTAAPNPLQAALTLLEQFSTGNTALDQAWTRTLNRFKADVEKYDVEWSRHTAAEDTNVRRDLAVQGEATERGKSVLNDFLPRALPKEFADNFTLPLIGKVPTIGVNTETVFDQGTGGLNGVRSATVPGPAPDISAVPFPPGMPAMPNIAPLVGAGASGFPGWNTSAPAAPSTGPATPEQLPPPGLMRDPKTGQLIPDPNYTGQP